LTQRSLLALIVAAIVLAGASVVVASTLGGAGDRGMSHRMPNGSTMNGSGMEDTNQTMPDGAAMDDDDMDMEP
jgi:hypothetical protein